LRLRPISTALSVDVARPVTLGFVLVISGAAALAVVFAGIVWSGKDLSALVYRPPHYWERAINFVQGLPFPRASGPVFAPYFLDGSE